MTKDLQILYFLKDNYSEEMIDLKPLIRELYPKVDNGNIEDLKEVAGEVIKLIHNLTVNKLINDDQIGLSMLGGSTAMVVKTFEDVKIKASITTAGITHLLNFKKLLDNNPKIEQNVFVTGSGNSVFHSGLDNVFAKPIKQKTKNQIESNPKKRSILELISWIVGIATGLLGIYEFVLKRFL